MSYDDFWAKLAEGHTTSSVTASVDSHLSGRAHGSDFERVRLLTQREREKRALQLPVPAGTKVSFTGGLGAVLGYEDPPVPGSVGEVVTVKSANGEITHHEGNVFVQWDDGKFRSINAVHLRRAGKTASDQQADKLEAEAEAAEDQAQADRAKADAERMKSASIWREPYKAGKWARRTKEFGDDMDEAALEWVTRIEDPESEEGKAMEVAFILGWLGKPMPRMGSRRHRMTPSELAEARALRDRIRNRGRMPAIDPDEYPPIRGMEGPFQFRGGQILYYDPKEGEYYDRKTDMYLYGDSRLAKKREGDPCWDGYEMVGMKKNDKGRMVPNCVPEKNVKKDKKARLRAASLGDLTEFLKVAEGTLIHKSTKDLWSFKKDADGMLQVERLFDDNGKPLKA